MELRELIEELLGRKVDLMLKGAIKSRLRERILMGDYEATTLQSSDMSG